MQHRDRVDIYSDGNLRVKVVTQPISFSVDSEIAAERIVEGDMGIMFGAVFIPQNLVASVQQKQESIFDRIGTKALLNQIHDDKEIADTILQFLAVSKPPPEANHAEF